MPRSPNRRKVDRRIPVDPRVLIRLRKLVESRRRQDRPQQASDAEEVPLWIIGLRDKPSRN